MHHLKMMHKQSVIESFNFLVSKMFSLKHTLHLQSNHLTNECVWAAQTENHHQLGPCKPNLMRNPMRLKPEQQWHFQFAYIWNNFK